MEKVTGSFQNEIKLLVGCIWYGLATIVATSILTSFNWYIRSSLFWKKGLLKAVLLDLVYHIIPILLILAFFRLIHVLTMKIGIRVGHVPAAPAAQFPNEPFPSPITMVVGGWLLVFSMASLAGLLVALSINSQSTILAPFVEKLMFINLSSMKEAVIIMLASGVGSSITTILGFLRHACVDKDFEYAYAPWYVGRPLMGIILGLIFYLLMKGGLLLTIPQEQHVAVTNLNDWAIAGIGTLVGMFSKNAIEKLREVFKTLFQTKDDLQKQGDDE